MPIKLLFTLIFVVNLSVFAGQNQDLLSISQQQDWQKLMHDHQILDKKFYITQNNKSSVLVELQANIERLQKDSYYSCQFPARAKYLSSKLNIQYSECSAVTDWKRSVSGETLSLVFVSQYVSNPASAFGHTFLLFRNKDKPLNFNVVISNAANIPDDVTDFEYIWKGLVGGFPAEFSNDYLYLKLQEYSNIENRDMWIYDLNFSKDEIDQVLNHIWEISRQTTQGYRFLNQNCAVNTYDVIAAVHPKLNFYPPSIYVLPVETVVKVFPITKDYEYIPSLREKIYLRTQKLQKQETEEFQKIISNISRENFISTKNPDVAELALEYYEFLRVRQDGKLSSIQNVNHQKSLINRAEIQQVAQTMDIPSPKPPHQASPPVRATFGSYVEQNQQYYFMSISPFYHSLLSKSEGYLPFSEFILLDFSIKKSIDYEYIDLALFRTANFPSTTIFDTQLSWLARVELTSDLFCKNCWSIGTDLGLGKSIELLSQSRLFALAGLYQNPNVDLSPQILLGSLFESHNNNLMTQLRVLKEESKNNLNLVYELGLSHSFNSQIQLEFFTSIENDRSSYQFSLGYGF